MPLYPPSRGMQPDRQVEKIADAFDTSSVDLKEIEGSPLSTSQEVVEATLENHLLVARTHVQNSRYIATIEYPVKTINANQRDWVYQTDTGPVLYPDLDREPEAMIAGMELAFGAFNCYRLDRVSGAGTYGHRQADQRLSLLRVCKVGRGKRSGGPEMRQIDPDRVMLGPRQENAQLASAEKGEALIGFRTKYVADMMQRMIGAAEEGRR